MGSGFRAKDCLLCSAAQLQSLGKPIPAYSVGLISRWHKMLSSLSSQPILQAPRSTFFVVFGTQEAFRTYNDEYLQL